MAFDPHGRVVTIRPAGNPGIHESWARLSCQNPHDRCEKTRGHTLLAKVWMKDYLAEVTKVLRSSGPNPSSVLKQKFRALADCGGLCFVPLLRD
ncbi:hypothetical protein TRAPUB_3600 [Trametes pubescens]|uniref:Uncharacterized protein n=1 Tax=Trametes pubescens TaxID=154538 RepID=A0A1M2VDH4_TRAPU|nr:hypothetical protein TRAPUB_3600 [Trametes pubescens]